MIVALLGFIKRILNAIGVNTDAVSVSSIFGRLNAVKEKTDTIGTNADSVTTNSIFGRANAIKAKTDTIGVSTDAENTNTTFGRLNAIKSKTDTIGINTDAVGANTAFGRLNAIKAKTDAIGVSSDADSTNTAFGRLNAIRVKTDTIGANTDAAGTTSVFARLRQIFENMLLRSTWTDQKAGYLDTNVNSRAPASTALSTAQWTNPRAGHLDKLNDGGIPGTFKSVQRGFGSASLITPIVINISAVNTQKAHLNLNGGAVGITTEMNPIPGFIMGYIDTSGTTIIIRPRWAVNPTSSIAEFAWEVVEYY